MKNLIKKIVLDIDGKEISLTTEQAQRLCTALMDLLGVNKTKDKEYIPYPVYPTYPYWRWDGPHFTWSGNTTTTDNTKLCTASYTANDEMVKLNI